MKRILLMIGLISAVIGVQAAKQYRDFTSADGKTISGCIVRYDAAKKIVTFERDNRKVSKVPISIFCEADQAYICDWNALSKFARNSSFKISAERKRRANAQESDNAGAVTVKVEDTYYEILLENKTTSMLKGLELEYCIYYEQEEGKNCRQGVYCGNLAVESMDPNSRKLLYTEAVSTYKSELGGGYYYTSGADSAQRGQVHGIKIRAHMKAASGQKQTREFSLPTGMKNKLWASSSKSAGMN